MVRRRCGLAETDDEATTRAAVAATVAEHVADETERRWIDGALLTLLGVGAATTAPAELFGAWRAFFERLADTGTVALVFEDFNYADAGLIDFVDHLLEWSRNRPIYVVTLARPDLLERRPDWHAKRNFTAVTLEPLPDAAMRRLLDGLVPGLPVAAADAIVARADGIPLYAVETVRMLLAEGRLKLEEGRYAPVGDLAELAIPDTLTALIASRLDGLPPDERSLVHDAAVLGQSFTAAGLTAVSGVPEPELGVRIRSLVRKEILAPGDARSPERHEHNFVQGLIREVAYHQLARADRKARHLAAARYFESLGSDELAGAVASHYLAARRDVADGPEADELVAHARVALVSAGERATTLGSQEQAARYFEQAVNLAGEPEERAHLLEQAGSAWRWAARHDNEINRLREAVDAYRELEDRPATARALSQLGRALSMAIRNEEAMAVLLAAVEEFADLQDTEVGVALLTAAARAAAGAEDYGRSFALADIALPAAERLDLPELIATCLATKGFALRSQGRAYEGIAIVRAGVELADRYCTREESLTLRNNYLILLNDTDLVAGTNQVKATILEARRLGLRGHVVNMLGNGGEAARWTGDWDWALGEVDALLEGDLDPVDAIWLQGIATTLHAWRGEDVTGRLAVMEALAPTIPDQGWLGSLRSDLDAVLGLAAGQLAEARGAALDYAKRSPLNAPMALPVAARAALWMRDPDAAADDLRALEGTGIHSPFVSLRRTVLRAGIAALEGRSAEARSLYAGTQQDFLDRGVLFEGALVGIDMVAVLGPHDPDARHAATEARPILERLGAKPFLARLESLLASSPDVGVGAD